MRYVDTSGLMAFLLPEAGSQLAERLMTSPGAALALVQQYQAELWTFDRSMSKAALHFGLRCQLLRSYQGGLSRGCT
jgi:predicted nucleic acid-binding protein